MLLALKQSMLCHLIRIVKFWKKKKKKKKNLTKYSGCYLLEMKRICQDWYFLILLLFFVSVSISNFATEQYV